MFNQIFFVFPFLCRNNKQKNKKDKNEKGNIPSGSAIEVLLALFLGTSGSLSRQNSRMKDIFKKGHLQKNFSSRKCLHLKKSSLHQSDPYLLLESAHIQ